MTPTTNRLKKEWNNFLEDNPEHAREMGRIDMPMKEVWSFIQKVYSQGYEKGKGEGIKETIKVIEDHRPHHEYCDAYKNDLNGDHDDEIEQDAFALKIISLLTHSKEKK